MKTAVPLPLDWWTSKVVKDFLLPPLPMVTKAMKRRKWHFLPSKSIFWDGTRWVSLMVYFCNMRFWIIWVVGEEGDAGAQRRAEGGALVLTQLSAWAFAY